MPPHAKCEFPLTWRRTSFLYDWLSYPWVEFSRHCKCGKRQKFRVTGEW